MRCCLQCERSCGILPHRESFHGAIHGPHRPLSDRPLPFCSSRAAPCFPDRRIRYAYIALPGTPIQECAEYPQITADGVVSQPALSHRYNHSVKVCLLQHIERQTCIQMLSDRPEICVVGFHSFVRYALCHLADREIFKCPFYGQSRTCLLHRNFHKKSDRLPSSKIAKNASGLTFFRK